MLRKILASVLEQYADNIDPKTAALHNVCEQNEHTAPRSDETGRGRPEVTSIGPDKFPQLLIMRKQSDFLRERIIIMYKEELYYVKTFVKENK